MSHESDPSKATPRVFVSYSWTDEAHKAWVLDLATDLRASGVDAQLDVWHLREGQDKHAFMEKMVTDPGISKVVIVCDRRYAERANERAGGVGTETEIITPNVYGHRDQSKFVAVVAETKADGEPWLPAYLASRKFIDMSRRDEYSSRFEELLRWIFDRPIHPTPPLGPVPRYILEEDAPASQTRPLAHRAIEAYKGGKSTAAPVLREYFAAVADTISSQRLRPHGDRPLFSDETMASIDRFRPVRDEFVNVLDVASRYGAEEPTGDLLHEFFDSLAPHLETRVGPGSSWEGDADNLRFLAAEFALHAVAVLARAGRFAIVGQLVAGTYDSGERWNATADVHDFAWIKSPLPTFDDRGRRTNPRRVSVRADVLIERCAAGPVKPEGLMEADFLLFLAFAIRAQAAGDRRSHWFPDTLIYRHGSHRPFRLFRLARSKRFFERLRLALGVETRSELEPVMAGFSTGKLITPSWNYEHIDAPSLAGWPALASEP